MSFQFQIKLTDQDYLDFNTFWMLKSPYGKKEILKMRLLLAAVFLVACCLSLIINGLSTATWLGLIPLLIIFAVAQALFNTIFLGSLKGQLKSLKKKGKMGYSPASELEFLEDRFVETTPDEKSETKYHVIERVSIVANKMIYLHVNNVKAYILPISCFESKEQFDGFLEFIKTKCERIDTYDHFK